MPQTEAQETERLRETVAIPEDGPRMLRERYGLGADDEFRIAFLTGPGDVRGTYDYWRKGRLDPRVPSVAYSAMFYELCRKLAAKAQIISKGPFEAPAHVDGSFRFDHISRPAAAGAAGHYKTAVQDAFRARRRLADFRPHAAIVSSDWPAFSLGVIRKPASAIVYSVHNTFWPMGRAETRFKDRIKRSLDALGLRNIGAAVCTSYECERQLAALTHSAKPAFTEIPQQRRRPPALKDGPYDGERRLLYLGRIEEDKGVFDLLDAFCALRERHQNLRLVFAGSGAASDALSQRIAALQTPAVEHLGRLEVEAVEAEFEKAYLLVCPTRSAFAEGLALVCIEAATFGVPSVMSSVVPASDLLADSAEVFAADSIAALTAALDRLLRDEDLWKERSRAARRSSEHFFNPRHSWGSKAFDALMAAAPQ